MKKTRRWRPPRLGKETIEKILSLHRDENLEAWEIARMLGIPERDVVYVIHPEW